LLSNNDGIVDFVLCVACMSDCQGSPLLKVSGDRENAFRAERKRKMHE